MDYLSSGPGTTVDGGIDVLTIARPERSRRMFYISNSSTNPGPVYWTDPFSCRLWSEE
jgi:hypothetical protein